LEILPFFLNLKEEEKKRIYLKEKIDFFFFLNFFLNFLFFLYMHETNAAK